MRNILSSMLVTIALGAGCSVQSDLMTRTGDRATTLAPEAGKALVVFLRPTLTGYAIQAAVYDGERFIGIVSRHAAVPYQADPGAHRFMVVSEAADFLDAELAPGRTYFVNVAPRMGAWRARFSLLPLSAERDARDVATWLGESTVVAPNADGQAWAERNHASVLKKKNAYEPKWLQKAARPTLHAGDGRAPTMPADTARPAP
jgi:hypothetical protein